MYQLEDLEAWKSARVFRKSISTLTKRFPDIEKYRLTDQLIRSSRSISANIAEGFGRYYYKENIQYCRQSRGSLYESLDHLYCALDEEYITDDEFHKYKNDFYQCLKILNGYIAFLIRSKTK